MTDEAPVPGLGSMLAVVMGALLVALAPFYAVIAFADDHSGDGLALLAVIAVGVVGAVGGARLRRGGTRHAAVVLGFAAACVVIAVPLVLSDAHRDTGLLLGLAAAALPLFVIAEKGWLRIPAETPHSDG